MIPYSFNDGTLVIGPARMTGMDSAEDQILSAKRSADLIFNRMTSDGKAVVGINSNQSGEIEVKLVQASPANAALGALLLLGRQVSTFQAFPIIWYEANTKNSIIAPNCTFKSYPPFDRGMAPGIQTWTFFSEDLTLFFGVPGA